MKMLQLRQISLPQGEMPLFKQLSRGFTIISFTCTKHLLLETGLSALKRDINLLLLVL